MVVIFLVMILNNLNILNDYASQYVGSRTTLYSFEMNRNVILSSSFQVITQLKLSGKTTMTKRYSINAHEQWNRCTHVDQEGMQNYTTTEENNEVFFAVLWLEK